MMNDKKIVEYWKNGADRSWEVAQSLFQNKKYPESLFFGQLTLEKTFKALIVAKTSKHAPQIHHLNLLAQKTNIPFTDKQLQELGTITEFSLKARYDEYRMNFFKRCTSQYTKEWLNKINFYHVWLKKELQKKSQIA